MKKMTKFTALLAGLALAAGFISCQTGVEEKIIEKEVEKIVEVEKPVEVEKEVPLETTTHEAVAVYHLKQNVNGIGYTKVIYEENADGTETTTAIESAQTVAANTNYKDIAKSFYGFTAKGLVESQQADGSYVVNVYYDRNLVTITINGDGFSSATSGLYDSGVDLTAVNKAVENGKFIASSNIPAKYPAENKNCTVTLGTRTVSPLDGFVSVPAGTFKRAISNTATASEITLTKGLYVCDHEVTQGEWEKYMTYYGIQKGAVSDTLYAPSENKGKGENFPVYFVNWYEAVIYCNLLSVANGLEPVYYVLENIYDPNEWADYDGVNGFDSHVTKSSDGKYYYSSTEKLETNEHPNIIICNTAKNGYRLPTEAEWEYLALGTYKDNSNWNGYGDSSNTTAYVFAGYDGNNSDKFGAYAWYKENGNSTRHEVKGKLPNTYGLYDISGNVWEWCGDWYADSYPSETRDPTGASSGYNRVIRGSSSDNPDSSCSVSFRFKLSPDTRAGGVGFRLVRNAD